MPFETKETDLASGVVVLAVSGSMTMGGELQRFEWQVERLIKENKNRLVLEASQLTYLDSAGIGVLVKISGLAKGAGGRGASVLRRYRGGVSPVCADRVSAGGR